MANVDEYNELKKMAIYCMHCGFCRQITFSEMLRPDKYDFWNSCPSGRKYIFEAYFAPGRMELARAIIGEEFSPEESKKLLEVAYACTTCSQCDIICHIETSLGRVKPTKVIEGLRAKLMEEGVAPLPNHKRFIDSVKNNHNPYQEQHSKRLNWWPSDIKESQNSENIYFVGCTSSYRTQSIAKNTALLMNKAGIEFRMLGGEEWCCGSPLLRIGARETAREVMLHNIKALKESGAKRIIFSCAGCYRTFKEDYPMYSGSLEPEFELLHVSQFLLRLVKNEKIKFKPYEGPNPVTYHDPCHMGRHMYPNQVYEPPRKLLESVPGLELVEMFRNKDFSWCCGAGGGVKAGFPEMAMETANIRLDEAVEVSAKAIISTCPFCWRNLHDAINEYGAPLEMDDLVEVLMKHL